MAVAMSDERKEPLATKPVSALPSNLQLVTDRREIEHTLEHIGVDTVDWDGVGVMFVDTYEGDYSRVWVVHGCVARNHDTAYRLR